MVVVVVGVVVVFDDRSRARHWPIFGGLKEKTKERRSNEAHRFRRSSRLPSIKVAT